MIFLPPTFLHDYYNKKLQKLQRANYIASQLLTLEVAIGIIILTWTFLT